MWLLIVHQLQDYHKNSTNFQQKMVLKQSGLIGNQLTTEPVSSSTTNRYFMGKKVSLKLLYSFVFVMCPFPMFAKFESYAYHKLKYFKSHHGGPSAALLSQNQNFRWQPSYWLPRDLTVSWLLGCAEEFIGINTMKRNFDSSRINQCYRTVKMPEELKKARLHLKLFSHFHMQ